MSLDEYWYPWSPSRYKADTMHLTALQDGIYRRLIDHYMETKLPLPDNDNALARIAGVSSEEFSLHSEIIRAFFTKATGKLQLKKCDGILADQAERRKSYSERGQKGGRGKTNKNNDEKAIAKLKATTGQDITRQDSTVQKDSSLNPPSVNKPPLPPKTPVPSASKGEGGFKKIDGVLGRMGLGEGSAGAFSIREHLTDYELREMLAICPGWDRNELFRQYNEWVAKKGTPRSPRAAFLAWCKKKPRNP